MKIYIDREKVNGRATLANLASVGGLLVLLASVIIPLFQPDWARFSLLLMAVGAIVAMIGIYLANRWVRKPRPEDSLDKALKAFDDHYRIYHYPALPCDHVLLTPAGLVALEVVNLGGSFSYRDGRWKEAMTMGRALRYMVEPRVADPVVYARSITEELGERLRRQLDAAISVPVKALTVFTHPAAELQIEGPLVPACKIEKLRKQVTISAERLASETYEQLSSFLERLTVR